MVSRTKLEIGSLIFAFLSLLVTALGSFWYSSYMVRVYIALVNITTAKESNLKPDDEYYVHRVMYINMTVAIVLSVMILSFAFSIILTKGLLSKTSHLVKAYFIYGVTGITFSVLFAIFVASVAGIINMALIIAAACFVYGLILFMIKKTYLQLATKEKDQCCIKNVVEEKSISIKL